MRALWGRVGAWLLLSTLAACGGDAAPGRAATAPRNAIVISLDTLRADRLGAYGYGRDTTPAIDRLAAEGVVFRQAVAESPWTIPSHFTLFTGLYPSRHGADQPDLLPAPEVTFLAERLAARGYYTAAFTDGGWLSSERFGRGFEDFAGVFKEGFAAKLPGVQALLEARGDEVPFFLFLHSLELHCPYDPPEPYFSLFRSDDAEPVETEGRCGNPHFNAMSLTPGQARFISDVYDGSLRGADDALAGFFDFLRESGLLERTVVVFTSDHGEEFLEHGRIGHEATLYREALMVPLVIRAPGFAARVVDTPVGLVDVAPTVLELLGFRDALPGVDGRSLVPLMRGGSPADFPAYRFAEVGWKARLDAWLGPGGHLIVDREGGDARYFDPAEDPLERRDLAAERAAEAHRLRADLDRFAAELRGGEPGGERRGLSPPERERLEALGYVLESPGD